MREWLMTLLRCVQAAWAWTRDLLGVLKTCRFSVAVLVIGAITLLWVEQAQEALRGLARPDAPVADFVQLGLFLLAVLLWAWNSWYCSRALLQFYFPDAPPPTPRIAALEDGLPRMLGALPPACVAIALWRAAAPYGGFASEEGYTLLVLAVICALFAAAFYARVVALYLTGKQPPVPAAAAKAFEITQLPAATRWLIYVFLTQALLAFFLFSLWPLGPAQYIGAVTILIVAAATWIPFGSLLIYFGNTYRLPPLMTSLIVLAVVFSLWNDNHAVRVVDDAPVASPAQRLRERAAGWIHEREADFSGKPRRYPMFIIATAGGGIRAAYWTAGTLSALEDRFDGFSRHVFAVSGVSGGSLGAAVYGALIAERRSGTTPACRDGDDPQLRGMRACASAVLSGDFLAPTLATTLYPDLVQRFLPGAVPGTDRATTLEQAWEEAWKSVMRSDRLARRFDHLWDGQLGLAMPSLFFNGTVVESGKRMIVSDVRVDSEHFNDAVDAIATLGCRVRISTAAHISARFTYLSPAGTVRGHMAEADRCKRGKLWGHVVDGGYFENSGATTAVEVLAALNTYVRESGLETRIMPVVILITNDPDRTGAPPEPNAWLNEARSPLDTMLHTRDARGSYSEALIKRLVRDSQGALIEFNIGKPPNNIPLPLGWMLSKSAKREMNRQLDALLNDRIPDSPAAQLAQLL